MQNETKPEYKSGCGYLECIATECAGCNTIVFDNKVKEPSIMDFFYLKAMLILDKINDIHIVAIFCLMVTMMFSLGIYIGWLVWGML